MLKGISYFILLFLISINTTMVFAQSRGPRGFNINGTVLENGTPVTGSVNFQLQIRDKTSNCVLYQEEHLSVTLTSSGAFSMNLGSGTSKQNNVDNSSTLGNNVFRNDVTVPSSASCPGGLTSSSGDERLLRIIYNAGSGTITMSPDVVLQGSPNAVVAETLQGLSPSDFLRVNTSGSTVLSQSNLENIFSSTKYARLDTLLSVNPSNYLQTNANGSVAVPTVAGNPASGLTVGQMWYDSATGKLKYYDGAVKTVGTGAGGGTVTEVTVSSPLAVSNGTTTPALSISQANSTTSGYLSSTDWSTFNNKLGTSSSFSGDVTGTSGTTSVDKIKGKTVSAATAANQIMIYDGTNWLNNVISGDATLFSTGALTIANNAVTTAKINDSAVTTAKINDSAVTSAKINAGAVTAAKLDSSGANGQLFIGNGTGFSKATLTQGPGISITNAAGGITIAAPDAILNGGNSFSGAATLGTNDAYSLAFKTSGATRMTILASGNIGIGTAVPGTNTKLAVDGQIKGKSFSTVSNAVDFSNGNAGTTSYDCAANISFANLRDGGSYTLVVTGTGTTQCNFDTNITGDDAATVTYRYNPANTTRSSSSHTIYSMLRVGNIVYVSWMTGM